MEAPPPRIELKGYRVLKKNIDVIKYTFSVMPGSHSMLRKQSVNVNQTENLPKKWKGLKLVANTNKALVSAISPQN